jgi:dihydroneopterin aldolase
VHHANVPAAAFWLRGLGGNRSSWVNSRVPKESHPLCDEIHIADLEISTRIGVPEQERAAPQRLTVNISFWPYQQTRDVADNIANTVNYSVVADETKRFVRDQSLSLIETLADRLANHLLTNFPLQKVTVELRKFPLRDAKYVSATVTRTASVG